MSLWWMQPEWKQTLCAVCGVHIWDSGGDPDHGVCYSCFMDRYNQSGPPEAQPEPSLPKCDICGQDDAIAGVNGFGVCSKECAEEAEKKVKPCDSREHFGGKR